MLSGLRKLLENWVARAFFGLLILVFIFWGISNVITLVGNNNAVAHVAGQPVDAALVQAAYQAQLQQAAQAGSAPGLAARQQLAATALDTVLRQRMFQREEQALGVAAPPTEIRAQIYAIPAFQTNGRFDAAKFDQVLQANNKTPDQFLADVRNNLMDRQMVLPMLASAAAPHELVDQIFAYIAEQRFAETVNISMADQPMPAAPAESVLTRYWRNHQSDFAAPEYREIKLVVLSPALLAPRETVSAAEIAAATSRATAGQVAEPLRSVQVITVDDPAKASALAAAWKNGADWTAMQSLAKKQGASAVELDSATQAQFPSPQLGAAVFAAKPGSISGPLPGAFGAYIFKVTAVASTQPALDQLLGQIKTQIQLQKAQAAVAQDVDRLQDALAGQTPLDKLPGDLGLVAVEGTLDANGNATDGTPAPIPGSAALKAAVIKAAFAAHVNDPAQLINGPDGSYFALQLDSITPPSVHPYSQVQARVQAAWVADERRRAAEVKAAALLQAVNAGQSLDAAASRAGLAITMSPPVTRNAPPTGMAPAMVQALFALKPGQATMQPADGGFTVAMLARIVQPSPAQDEADYAQVSQAMDKAMQNDVVESFTGGLQRRDQVSIDQKLFAQIYQ